MFGPSPSLPWLWACSFPFRHPVTKVFFMDHSRSPAGFISSGASADHMESANHHRDRALSPSRCRHRRATLSLWEEPPAEPTDDRHGEEPTLQA